MLGLADQFLQLNRRFIRCSLSLSHPPHRMNSESLNKSGAEGRRGKNTENRVSFRSRATWEGVKSGGCRCLLHFLCSPAVSRSDLVLRESQHRSHLHPRVPAPDCSHDSFGCRAQTTTKHESLDQLLIYFPFIFEHGLFYSRGFN